MGSLGTILNIIQIFIIILSAFAIPMLIIYIKYEIQNAMEAERVKNCDAYYSKIEGNILSKCIENLTKEVVQLNQNFYEFMGKNKK